MEENLTERNNKREHHPYFDHLNIRCEWQLTADTDKHCCCNQHDCEVDGYNGLEEEMFEEACKMTNCKKKNSWDNGRQNNLSQISGKSAEH